MMKFMRKTGGYISIFLCIILLPMVIYSAMIIDASRLQASKTQLQIAGDLVMNAAMSEYDKILQDMYGLFANAESADDLKPALNKYFNETISGITGDENNQETSQFVDELTDSIFQEGSTSQDVSNYLYMKLNDFTYDPIEESSLANPLILKSQIIDYMKYKGPVSIASNLMTKIGILKDSSNQANAVQKKIEYTQKLEKLDDPMRELWKVIKKYNEHAEQYKAKKYDNEETIKNMLEDIKSQVYIIAEAKVLSNCIDDICEKSNRFKKINGDAFDKINVDERVALYESSINKNPNNVDDAENALNTIINELNYKIINPTGEENAEAEFEKSYGKFQIKYNDDQINIDGLTFGVNNSTSEDYTPTYGNISKWLNDFSNFTGNKNSINEQPTSLKITYLIKLYDNQKKYIDEMDKISDYKVYYEDFCMLKGAYDDVYNKYIKEIENKYKDAEDKTTLNEYRKAKNIFDKVSAGWKSSEMYKQYFKFVNSLNNFSYYSESVFKECQSANYEIAIYYNVVSNINQDASEAVEKLEKIKDLVNGEIKTAENDWNNSINQVKDADAKSGMTSDLSTTTKNIKIEDVENLLSLMSHIKDLTDNLKKDIESVKFVGNSLCSTTIIDFATLNNDNLKADCYDTRNSGEVILETVGTNIKQYKLYDSGSLLKEGIISINVKPIEIIDGKTLMGEESLKEAFYYVLKNSYEENHKEDLKDEDKGNIDKINAAVVVDGNGNPNNIQSAQNEIQDAQKDKAAQTENSGNQEGGQQDSQQVTGGLADAIKDAQNEIFNAKTDVSPSNNNAQGVGKIPSTEGSEEDVKENAKNSADKGKSNLSNAQNLLSKIGQIGQSLRDNVYLEEYFTEMFTCQTDGKKNKPVKLINGYSTTDSERPINTKNAWYNKEIEYILWGDADLDSNITKTDATIFLMRFATNAIYAFTASDIQGFANTTATALVGWTVVLVPIVQVCIVLAIALAESAYDLALLKNGDSVPILKDTSTFFCSPTGLLSNAGKKLAEVAVEKVADVAEEKINKAIDKIATDGEKKISQCESEINGMVQDYTDSIKNSIETSIDDQITTPLINSISPMLSRLDDEASNAENLVNETIDTAWEDIGSSINGMDEGTVKSLTLEFYNNYAKDVKDDIKNAIIGEINGKKEAISVDSIHTLISEKIGDILKKYLAGPINAEVSKITKQMKEEIMSHGNEAVSNLKGYVHEGMSSVSSKLTGKITETLGNGQGVNKSGSGGITINYKEYCKILMFIGFIGQEENYLKRAAALIQANVKYSAKGSNPNFSMTKAYTLFYVGSTVEMRTLFPWGVSINTSDVDAQGSANLDFSNLGNNSVKINYSGINGY